MRILIAASELAPFAKVGGLGEVTASFSKALSRRGHEVAVVLPKYLMVDRGGYQTEPIDLPLLFRIEDEERTGWIHTVQVPKSGVTAYFVVNDHFFNRNGLYQENGKDFPDNLARFTFFCRGALELVRSGEFVPDIFHCQDWQTGLIPAYLKTCPEYSSFKDRVKVVFSFLNIAYQGFFPKDQFPVTGLSWDLFSPDGIEFYGDLNLLKSGLFFSDHIPTICEKYVEEIMTPEHGCGLEDVIAACKDRLTGILGGVDYDIWNPESDELIPCQDCQSNLKGKSLCKSSLQESLGLPFRDDAPLFGVLCWESDHNEMDLIPDALEVLLLGDEIQLVAVSVENSEAARVLMELKKRFPKQVGVLQGNQDLQLHRLLAGADLTVFPGRVEPAGLVHLVSLRYGTPPIVRKVGAVCEAVRDYNEAQKNGYGFIFHNPEARDLNQAIRRAISVYRDKTAWTALVRRAMACDFSWDETARKYEDLYTRLLEDHS